MLSDKAFNTLREAEDYAEKTNASLLILTLQCLGIEDVKADHAASHLGQCQGLTTLLRAIPFNASNNRVYLPIELLIHHNISQQDVLRGGSQQAMKDLVYDIASNANIHLEKAKEMQKSLPKNSHLALLPAVSCSQYLKKLQQLDFDVFHPTLQQRNNLLPLSLWWRKTRKTY